MEKRAGTGARLASIRTSVCLMVAGAMAAALCAGCGKKGSKESAQPAEARKGKPAEQVPDAGTEAARPGAPAKAVDGGSGTPPVQLNLSKDSPTGLAECDAYLKQVCACADKHTALKMACEAAKRSAPKWKQSAQSDPQSIGTVRGSCIRAMKSIRDGFKCN